MTTAAPRRPGAAGRLFVLSGPSGVGKSTVIAGLRSALPDLWISVSATTRRPRPGEINGRNYFFVTPTQFRSLVDAGEMLEWAEFAGNLYGTPRAPVSEQLAVGRDVLLEIDVQGARQVRAAMRDLARLIFLAPPSFDELARRLVGRGTESDDVRQNRLVAARVELAAEPEFDHTVVNSDVDDAVKSLVEWVADQRLR